MCVCVCVWHVVKPGPHVPLWPGCTKEMPHRPQDVLFTVKCSYNSNALRLRKCTSSPESSSTVQIHILNDLSHVRSHISNISQDLVNET